MPSHRARRCLLAAATLASPAGGRAQDLPFTAVTDRAGRFTFRLPAGCYRLLPEDELGDWHWLCPPIDVGDGPSRPLTSRLDRD